MKTSRITIVLSLILSILMFTNTWASSVRCGSRLITLGDYKARVLSECGEPDYIEVWEEERIYRFHSHPGYYGIYDNYEYKHSDDIYGRAYRIRKLVIVEEWTYNHGPGRFMDHLILENGIVRRITSGDYGY